MGKKRIIQQNEEELLKEKDKVEAKVKKEGKEVSKKLKNGRIYISSSYNNTLITLTDENGNTLAWTSSGLVGFKGSKKSTPFAASKVAESVAQTAQKFGIEKIAVFVKGVGSGRESAVRSLAAKGLDIIAIEDITPTPHNGCRPPKARRV